MEEMGTKLCYCCGKKITFNEFYQANKDQFLSFEIIEKIWDNEFIELFCCRCFRIFNGYTKEDVIQILQNEHLKKQILEKIKAIEERMRFNSF
jgi:DNA-directed RNA polymerase subunit N (RpoN/RPB10)